MFCARVAVKVVEGPSVSTGSRSTSRLGRPRAWNSQPRLVCSNDLRYAEELVTEVRRAMMDLHGSKSILAFAWDVYYIGRNYETTGPKDRPTWRRREAAPARGIVQVDAGVGALLLH